MGMLSNKDKGDLATAKAINHLMSDGYEVSLPIGNKRPYDLVAEKDGKLSKVQVKYAGFYGGSQTKCKVALRTMGGNQSFHYAKRYADDAFDLLFVYTARGDSYLVPWTEVSARNELSIESGRYARYKIMLG